MARKGDRYTQVPTLWYVGGLGYPCRVMRRRRVWATRTIKGAPVRRRVWKWINYEHEVLTLATWRRWKHQETEGKAIIRRDVNLEAFMQVGIVPKPRRQIWATEAPPVRGVKEKTKSEDKTTGG